MSEMEREERRKAESKEKPTQARPSSEKNGEQKGWKDAGKNAMFDSVAA